MKRPDGLRAPGTALWASVTADNELAHHELLQLGEAARLADSLADLQAVIDVEGVTVTGEGGVSKPHPAFVEARHQRLALSRLLAALRVPDEGDQRPQRRAGVRKPYKPRSAS